MSTEGLGFERPKNKPSDTEILNHEGRETLGEKSVAEMFESLSGKPFSDVGLKEVLERLSIEAVSGRN